jgi:hypothetical protein
MLAAGPRTHTAQSVLTACTDYLRAMAAAALLARETRRARRLARKCSPAHFSRKTITAMLSIDSTALDWRSRSRGPAADAEDGDDLTSPVTSTRLMLAPVADPAKFASTRFSVYGGDEEGEYNLRFLKGTTTLAFKFQGGVVVSVDSRSTQGPYIGELLGVRESEDARGRTSRPLPSPPPFGASVLRAGGPRASAGAARRWTRACAYQPSGVGRASGRTRRALARRESEARDFTPRARANSSTCAGPAREDRGPEPNAAARVGATGPLPLSTRRVWR